MECKVKVVVAWIQFLMSRLGKILIWHNWVEDLQRIHLVEDQLAKAVCWTKQLIMILGEEARNILMKKFKKLALDSNYWKAEWVEAADKKEAWTIPNLQTEKEITLEAQDYLWIKALQW